MTADELERTARYRPRLELRDADAIIGRILQDAPPVATRSYRRPVALVGLAAAIAVAAAVVPAVLPSSAPGGPAPAAAAELRRLAGAAITSGDESLLAGQFRHVVVTSHQADPALSTALESWTGADGRVWRRDTSTHEDGTPGRTETFLFTTPEPVTTGFPTDPNALQHYLVAHASGSTSTDEAVFSQLSDLLRGYAVPAALRSAATEVLARSGHVRLGPRTTDSFGRLVQEVDFVDEVGRPGEVQAIVFDTADARVTAERITITTPLSASSYYESAVAPADVTDEVPADVLRDAVAYGSGGDTNPSHGG